MNQIRMAIDDARSAYHDSTRWRSESPDDGDPTYEEAINAAIEAQTKRIADLEACLKWYAQEWMRDSNGEAFEPTDALWDDKGTRAREALKE